MDRQLQFESQFLSDNFADVHFIINTSVDQVVQIPSHKVILAASSPILQQFFAVNVDVQNIKVANTTMPAFKEFLYTFYSQNADKYFTIENAAQVLALAKEFGAVRASKANEQFLMRNLSIGQICLGYAIAIEHKLYDLKAVCTKKINDHKIGVFISQSFYGCNQLVLIDILENVTFTNLDEKKLIWDACMIWADQKSTGAGMNSSNVKIRRDLLGKCFDSLMVLVSNDGAFKEYVMQEYPSMFNEDEQENTLTESQQEDQMYLTTFVCNSDMNQNEIVELEFVRLRETMLATQLCGANKPFAIMLQTTKKVALHGIAFATAIGIPSGKLAIISRNGGADSVLMEQTIEKNSKRREPRNYIPIENVNLEPNRDYIIRVELSKDLVYYQSRLVADVYSGNGLTVKFKKENGHDVFSHFVFNDCF